MSNRKALIVSPSYNGQQFQYLLGGHSLSKYLKPCLEADGEYQVEHLTGSVTKSDLRKALEKFFSDDDGAELLFYYYGHGFLQNNLGIFVTSDYAIDDFGVFMFELASAVSNSKAREIVVILDCCHSGASLSPYFDGLQMVVTRSHGRVFLAACQPHQSSMEMDDSNYGPLSKLSIAIVDALSGKVESIIGGEGAVRGSNLGNYVTGKISDWDQTPIFNISETGNRLCIITRGFKKLEERLPPIDEIAQSLVLNVPFKPSVIFEGRDAELNTLVDTILVGGNVAVCASVEGLGGIGKTELILQFIYDEKIQKYFNTIVWIDASGAIEAQWENVANLLSMRPASSDINSIITEIETFLKNRGKAIIIIDNANEWNEISHLFPSNIPLLVTTRTLEFGGIVFRHQELSFLTNEAAKRILLAIDGRMARDNNTAKLIQRLGGHALAIELAGLNIKTLNITVKEYLARLDTSKVDPENVLLKTKHQKTVEQCLLLTWNRLSEASQQLWIYASMFAPVPASREFLRNIFQGYQRVNDEIIDIDLYEEGKFVEQLSEHEIFATVDFDVIFSELIGYGILSRVEDSKTDEPSWNMHRLVRDFAIIKISRFHRVRYLLNISEWLRVKNIVSEDEIPHVVTAILDSAQHLGNLRTSFGFRNIGWESYGRGYSKRTIRQDPLRLLRHVKTELKAPKVIAMISDGIANPNPDVQLQAIELLKFAAYSDEYIVPLINNLMSDNSEVRKSSQTALYDIRQGPHDKHLFDEKLAELIEGSNHFAIQFIGDGKGKEFLNSKVFDQLTSLVGTTTDDLTKAYALHALYSINSDRSLLESLISLFLTAKIESPDILIKTIHLVRRQDYFEQTKNLFRELSQSENTAILTALISQCKKLKGNDSIGILLSTLDGPKKDEISELALDAIASISRSKATLEKLISFIDSSKINNSKAYVGVISMISERNYSESAQRFLVEASTTDDSVVLEAVIKKLEAFNDENSLGTLLSIWSRLRNSDPAAKHTIRAILATVDKDNLEKVSEALVQVLKSKNASIGDSKIDSAILAVGELSLKEAVNPLIKILCNQRTHNFKAITDVLLELCDEVNRTEIEAAMLSVVENQKNATSILPEVIAGLAHFNCYEAVPSLLRRIGSIHTQYLEPLVLALRALCNDDNQAEISLAFTAILADESHRIDKLGTVLTTLGDLKRVEAIPVILWRFRKTDPSTAKELIIVLNKISWTFDFEVLKNVLKILDDGKSRVLTRIINKSADRSHLIKGISDVVHTKNEEFQKRALAVLLVTQHNFFVSQTHEKGFKRELLDLILSKKTSEAARNYAVVLLIAYFHQEGPTSRVRAELFGVLRTQLHPNVQFIYHLYEFVTLKIGPFTEEFIGFLVNRAVDLNLLEPLIDSYARFFDSTQRSRLLSSIVEFVAHYDLRFESSFLIEQLRSEFPRTRSICAIATGAIKLEAGFDKVVELLNDNDVHVQIAAIKSIRLFDNPRGRAPIQELLKKSKADSVQREGKITLNSLMRTRKQPL